MFTPGGTDGPSGELVTDCRYLNLQGARAAINSEAGIEERRTYKEWHDRQVAEQLRVDGGKRSLGCECGWRGGYEQLEKGKFGVVVLRCPKCESHLLYLSVPSDTGASLKASRTKSKAATTRRPRRR
jgi:hypothetical protein